MFSRKVSVTNWTSGVLLICWLLPTVVNAWITLSLSLLPSIRSTRSNSQSTIILASLLHPDNHADQLFDSNVSRKQFCAVFMAGASVFLSPVANTILSNSFIANAMNTDSKTGIALPDEGEIEASIPKDWTNVDNPFDAASSLGGGSSFGRLDSSPDSLFYKDPRFVEHVDEQAVKSMTSYITNQAIPKSGDNIQVLDLCSSWTSHIDLSNDNISNRPTRIAGLGMNEKELAHNAVLTDWVVADLNEKPNLPYDDNTFDVVLCQLSIDYLTRPLEVMREVGRVLKPGGTVHVLFSNRLFLSKAVALWTGADDIDHAYTVGCYLHFCNAGFSNIQAKDLSTRKGRDRRIVGDPLYVVTGKKN